MIPKTIMKNGVPRRTDGSRAALQEGRDNKNRKGKRRLLLLPAFWRPLLWPVEELTPWHRNTRRYFSRNTIINGMNASGRTVAEVKEMIAGGIENYVLTIEEREGGQEQLTGEDIKLKAKFDGTLEQIVTTQNPYAWLSYQLNPAEYTIGTMIEYDEEAFTDAVKGLKCMDTALMKEPENAGISDYVPGQGYHIVPETAGTYVSEDVLRSKDYRCRHEFERYTVAGRSRSV